MEDRGRRQQRHPGGRPRRAAGRHRGAGRRAADASPTSRRPAACRSPRPRGCSPRSSAPSCSSARRPGATSPAACSGCTPRGTTRGRSWSGSAGPMHGGGRRGPRETVNLSVTRGDRVVQVAQVDSHVPARHPRLDRGRRARPLLRRSARCCSPGARWTVPAARSSSRPTAHLTDPEALRADGSRARAARLGASPSTSSRSGSPASPSRSAGTAARSSRPWASRDPRPRLAERLDELGRLLDTTAPRAAVRAAPRQDAHKEGVA